MIDGMENNIAIRNSRWFRFGALLISAIGFGVLMASRDVVGNIWLRAAIAAVAFGGFAAVTGWLNLSRIRTS
jgi:hypothetical protein